MAASPAYARTGLLPFASVVALYAVSIAGIVLAGRNWILVAFLASMAFAVVNPMVCAFGDRWWRDTVESGIGFVGTFVMYAVLAEADVISLREDAMGLLGPAMLYAAAVPTSGVLRLLVRRLRHG